LINEEDDVPVDIVVRVVVVLLLVVAAAAATAATATALPKLHYFVILRLMNFKYSSGDMASTHYTLC